MVEGFLETAKAYIIYRKEHQDNREFRFVNGKIKSDISGD